MILKQSQSPLCKRVQCLIKIFKMFLTLNWNVVWGTNNGSSMASLWKLYFGSFIVNGVQSLALSLIKHTRLWFSSNPEEFGWVIQVCLTAKLRRALSCSSLFYTHLRSLKTLTKYQKYIMKVDWESNSCPWGCTHTRRSEPCPSIFDPQSLVPYVWLVWSRFV